MANFDIALKRTLQFEGGYSNNPHDPGGETYCGISRKNWPDWEGWEHLDDVEMLESLIRDFYREHFWGKLHGDEIASQDIANELFDAAVNCGLKLPVQWLQRALNALNSGKKDDLWADGKLGSKTFDMLSAETRADLILSIIRAYRVAYYADLAGAKINLRRFLPGWLNRVSG